MNETESLQHLYTSATFKNFKKEHPDYYLTHLFTMISEGKPHFWQVGFYSKKTDRMITFDISDPIVQHQPDEVFKTQDYVEELSMKDVISAERAIEKAEDLRQNTYPGELEYQKIVVLQNLQDEGIVWRITLFSLQQNFIIIHLKASDGQILKHELGSIRQISRDKV